MPTSIAEFEDETAYERYVLEHTASFFPKVDGRSIIELGDGGTTSANVHVPPARVRVLVNDGTQSYDGSDGVDLRVVRAMIFGAAWKVLDLLVELSLNQGPAAKNRYRIEFKTQQATDGNVSPLAPLSTMPDVWNRVMMSYVATTALRHSLVHRCLEVDRTTGTMTATSDPRDPPALPMTADEQVAFCRIADGVAQAVITGKLAPRQEDSVRWLLDQLVAHHGKDLYGVTAKDGLVPEVIIRPTLGATNDVTIDFASVRQRALHAVGGVSYYDLRIHLPNGWILATPLEDAPDGRLTFSIDQLPAWLRRM
ncbi:hypothetical protein [Nocardia vinacea]|uniref:hypothetical protein n=1 Tax=Nocardia vinacea TaxID=96468 RepID=UPI00059420A2|nr:hypothetical protein [Nocardia vinacea]